MKELIEGETKMIPDTGEVGYLGLTKGGGKKVICLRDRNRDIIK